jgi:hypothetical protein
MRSELVSDPSDSPFVWFIDAGIARLRRRRPQPVKRTENVTAPSSTTTTAAPKVVFFVIPSPPP